MSAKKAMVIILVIIILLGIAFLVDAYNSTRYSKISSFEECADAGYPIMESYPERCMTPDGRGFTRILSPEEREKLNDTFATSTVPSEGTGVKEKLPEELYPSDPTPPIDGSTSTKLIGSVCKATGCSGTICSDREVYSTCEWRDEYTCYNDYGVCERQSSGECGWKESKKLNSCLTRYNPSS